MNGVRSGRSAAGTSFTVVPACAGAGQDNQPQGMLCIMPPHGSVLELLLDWLRKLCVASLNKKAARCSRELHDAASVSERFMRWWTSWHRRRGTDSGRRLAAAAVRASCAGACPAAARHRLGLCLKSRAKRLFCQGREGPREKDLEPEGEGLHVAPTAPP